MNNKLKQEAVEQATLYDMALADGELLEYRVFGSPGTGKTTNLTRQISLAVDKHGADKVVVASFTRTAATELVSRGLPIPRSNIATLHAHAYRALNRPELLDGRAWNDHIRSVNSSWELTTSFRESAIEEPDMPQGKTNGDDLLSKYELSRAKMITIDHIFNQEIKSFAVEYEAFKKDNEVIDFTDMISLALQNVDELPQKPSVGFFDECFPRQTAIRLADGTTRAIDYIVDEKLEVDVLSYNTLTKQQEACRIIGWSKTANDKRALKIQAKLIDMNLEGRYCTFKINCTYNHKIYANNDWIIADDLKLGDICQVYSDGKSVDAEVIKIEDHTLRGNYVYDITVERLHNFYAGGFLVHNCQDFTPLELALVRKWGAKMELIVMAGDDDQAIFSFKGVSPTAFINPPISENYLRVLPQSYRVPAVIHAKALSYIEQLTNRQYKKYMPRFEQIGFDEQTNRRIYDEKHVAQGELTYRQSHLQDKYYVDSLIGEANDLNSAGKSAMFLTACSYQLDVLKNTMRHNGIAFHNPYRTVNGSWNPLGKGATITKIATFIYADERRIRGEQATWTVREFLTWADLVKATGVFKRGALTKLKSVDEEQVLSVVDLGSIFHSYDVMQAATHGDLSWLQSNVKTTVENRMSYLLKCIDRYGLDYLLNNKPKIILGTIHSVKGGESDHVFLSPDLSYQGYQEYTKNQDATIRCMYVAMTRAFEGLHILAPSGNQYARIK